MFNKANRHRVGKMDRRITCTNYTNGKTASGGATLTPTQSIVVWAFVENRSGSYQNAQANMKYEYDYKVTLRFRGEINSATVLQYESEKMRINSLQIKSEGMKNYLIARCSKITL